MAAPAPSLRRQLLAWLLPVAAISLLAGTLGVYLIALNASAEALDQGLADATDIYVENLRAHPEAAGRDLPPRAQRVLEVTSEDRVFFSLLDAEGRLLAGESRLAEDQPWGTLQAPSFFDVTHSGYWLRGISVVFEAGGKAKHLILATTALKREKLMDNILLGMVAPQTMLFLATIALVWAGISQGLAPLATLRAEIGQRSHRDLRPLDGDSAPEELRPIVEDINRLFARLAGAIESQRNFIADAAHQLRTPVAGLLAQVESSGTAADNPALAATTRRLSHLVAQLLALSRAEPGMEPELAEFDLAALIRDAANEWLPQAFRRDLDVGFDLAETRIYGSAHAFREMLANLVDNAIRYGRVEGHIVVRCRSSANEAVIQVDDDGPGIPAELREKVFERFYRVPGTQADGCGLGLPIVAGLLRQHHGRIALSEAPELGGLRVEMHVPLAPA